MTIIRLMRWLLVTKNSKHNDNGNDELVILFKIIRNNQVTAKQTLKGRILTEMSKMILNVHQYMHLNVMIDSWGSLPLTQIRHLNLVTIDLKHNLLENLMSTELTFSQLFLRIRSFTITEAHWPLISHHNACYPFNVIFASIHWENL